MGLKAKIQSFFAGYLVKKATQRAALGGGTALIALLGSEKVATKLLEAGVSISVDPDKLINFLGLVIGLVIGWGADLIGFKRSQGKP